MQNKERVLALDYFRGLCMLAVIINHFSLFASPLTLLAGGGRLWVGAAELFFLISGVTFGIVRGKSIKKKFDEVIKKSFKRAGLIYAANLLAVIASMGIAFQLAARGSLVNIPGDLPAGGVGHSAWQILTLQYGYGWADFLMYYSLLLLVAPFALKLLYSRLWLVVPAASIALFGLTATPSVHANAYLYFFIWQLYFFIGMTIARFRLDLLGWFNRSSQLVKRSVAWSMAGSGLAVLTISSLVAYNHKITASGAPAFIKQASRNLAGLPDIDLLTGNARTGLLRPVIALMALAMLYVFYQRFKQPLLKYSGKFVMSFGRNSLQIFVAQAMAIPLISALPLRRSSWLLNTGLTATLIFVLWLFNHKLSPLPAIRSAFMSFYAGTINRTYQILVIARDIRARLISPELD